MATALIVRLAYKDLPTGRGEKLGVLISVDKRSGAVRHGRIETTTTDCGERH